MKEANVHSGHRERMLNKFMSHPESMLDHELLEMFLFDSIKRKDTNELAHSLLNTFGNIKNVFSASAKELTSVKGIGEKTAKNILLYGALFQRIQKVSDKPKKPLSFSFAKNKQTIIEMFEGVFVEVFSIILLDKTYTPLTTMTFTDYKANSVSGNLKEIANAIAINKPTYAMIAHNHPSGNVTPSKADDLATVQINILFLSHGVTLLDHVIVNGENAYSYYIEHRLEKLKKDFSFETTLKASDEEGVNKWIE